MQEMIKKFSWLMCSPVYSEKERLNFMQKFFCCFRRTEGEEWRSELEAVFSEMEDVRQIFLKASPEGRYHDGI